MPAIRILCNKVEHSWTYQGNHEILYGILQIHNNRPDLLDILTKYCKGLSSCTVYIDIPCDLEKDDVFKNFI